MAKEEDKGIKSFMSTNCSPGIITEAAKFSPPLARWLYYKQIEPCQAIDCHTVENSTYSRHLFSRFATYGLEPFLNIYEAVNEDVVCLFYANMIVINDKEPIIQTSILETHIEFNLDLFYQILELPNEGDHYYFITSDDLPAYCELNQMSTSSSSILSKRLKLQPIWKRIFGSFQNDL